MATEDSRLDRFSEGEERASLSEPCSDQIDDVVNQLNGICRASSLEFALRVGAVVIHHFYDGDTNAWRDRGPKANSFRRLAAHPDLQISPGALYRCVAVFELCDRLRAAARWRRLGASHLRAVIGVPAERQEELLAAANEQRWSVQVIQSKARELRDNRSRGGRRPQSPLEKNLRALDQCLRDCRDVIGHVESHQREELEQSSKLLAKLKACMEELALAVEVQRIGSAEPSVEATLPRAAASASWVGLPSGSSALS